MCKYCGDDAFSRALTLDFLSIAVCEVFSRPLERGLEILLGLKGVERVRLAGDHLRVINTGVRKDALSKLLSQQGIEVEKIEQGEPTLEDVFLSLA